MTKHWNQNGYLEKKSTIRNK